MLRPLGATTETTFSESTDARALSSGLLQLVAALAKDLSPGGSRQTSPTLDSRFNEDLGLDSLTLVELLLRAERDLGVSFRDGAIAAATPRELLQFIQFGPAAEAIRATTEELPSRPVGEVPSSAETLSEVLAWHRSTPISRAEFCELSEPHVLECCVPWAQQQKPLSLSRLMPARCRAVCCNSLQR